MKQYVTFRAADWALCLLMSAALAAAVCAGFEPEELGTYLWLILLVTAVLTFLLARTKAGTGCLFVIGTILCAGAYFLRFPIPLWSLLLFEPAVIAMFLYRVWFDAARRAEAGAVRGGAYALQTAALCFAAFAIAGGLYFGVVRPLNPPTRELRLITLLKSMDPLQVLGVYRTEIILDPDMFSEAPPEETEQGGEQGEEESSAPDNLSEDPPPPQGQDGADDYGAEPADTVRYDFSDFNPLWLLLLLPVLTAGAYGLRAWRKKRWHAAVKALPPEEAVANYYTLFLSRLGRAGHQKPAHLTLRQYAEQSQTQLEPLIRAEGGFRKLTEIYEKVLYGGGKVSGDERRLFEEAYAAFYRALRREVGTVKYYLTAFRY